MKYGRYGMSYLFLRVGLGLMFLWIGIDMFRHGETWVGYLPANIPFGISRETALMFTGALDVALGVFLLVKAWPKLTALLATIHVAGVLIVHGIDAVLIRDVGLLGAALALFVWPYGRRSRRFGFWRRKNHSQEEEG